MLSSPLRAERRRVYSTAVALLRTLQRALFHRVKPGGLGEVTAPRLVTVDAVVSGPSNVMSPVTGRALAYFHLEVGESVRLGVDDLIERFVFHPFAELRSEADLMVRTLDDREILLPAGYFLVRRPAVLEGIRLDEVPDGLRALVSSRLAELGGKPIDLERRGRSSGSKLRISFRQIALRPGDRVRFSGIVEPIVTPVTGGYRDAPGVFFRMRPEREPIIVEEAA